MKIVNVCPKTFSVIGNKDNIYNLQVITEEAWVFPRTSEFYPGTSEKKWLTGPGPVGKNCYFQALYTVVTNETVI